MKRLPQTEVDLWQQYAAKHGGLPLQRVNVLLAHLATMTNNAHGGKAELRDFLPGLPPSPPDEVDTADKFFAALGLA